VMQLERRQAAARSGHERGWVRIGVGFGGLGEGGAGALGPRMSRMDTNGVWEGAWGEKCARCATGRCPRLQGGDGERGRCRAYASDDAIKVDFMIKVKERATGMGNRSRA
jgi:hypothetical protein